MQSGGGHVPQPSKECGDVEESEQLCGSGCSGTIQRLGKVLQGSEDVSNDVQGLEGGLERFGESGTVWGGVG